MATAVLTAGPVTTAQARGGDYRDSPLYQNHNGDLLRLAEPDFEVFVTMDRQLPFQQNLAGLDLCIIILAARSNDIADLRALAPKLRSAVSTAAPGQLVTVGA